jgi:hypothetical protein
MPLLSRARLRSECRARSQILEMVFITLPQ